MIDFKKAKELAANYVTEMNENAHESQLAQLTGIIPDKKLALRKSYGEVSGKYVFAVEYSAPEEYRGSVPPGGASLTVDKETGECKSEYLERAGNKPWSPIKGYVQIEELADD